MRSGATLARHLDHLDVREGLGVRGIVFGLLVSVPLWGTAVVAVLLLLSGCGDAAPAGVVHDGPGRPVSCLDLCRGA